jgi:hypothetical protein
MKASLALLLSAVYRTLSPLKGHKPTDDESAFVAEQREVAKDLLRQIRANRQKSSEDSP